MRPIYDIFPERGMSFDTHMSIRWMRRQRKQKVSRRRKRVVNRAPRQSQLSIRNIMPPTFTTHLTYTDELFTRVNVGAQYLVYSYRMNDIYDPDPLLLTGGVAGFSDLLAFYQEWRVEQVSVQLRIGNMETFPQSVCIIATNTNVAASISNVQKAVNATENPFSTGVKLMSGMGGMDRMITKSSYTCGAVFGNRQQYNVDPNTSGFGASNPSTLLYLTVIVFGPSPQVKGVFNDCRLRFKVKFFNRVPLLD